MQKHFQELIQYLGSYSGRKCAWEGWEEDVLTFLDEATRTPMFRPDFETMKKWLSECDKSIDRKVCRPVSNGQNELLQCNTGTTPPATAVVFRISLPRTCQPQPKPVITSRGRNAFTRATYTPFTLTQSQTFSWVPRLASLQDSLVSEAAQARLVCSCTDYLSSFMLVSQSVPCSLCQHPGEKCSTNAVLKQKRKGSCAGREAQSAAVQAGRLSLL